MKTCPTCKSSEKDGIMFRAEAVECMACEGVRDTFRRLRPDLPTGEVTQEIVKAAELWRLGEKLRHARATVPGTKPASVSIGRAEIQRRLEDCRAIVDKALGLTTADLRSEKMSIGYARTRHVFFWLAREVGLHLQAIGDFANRDHSTVVHGVNAMKKRARADPDVKEMLTAMLHRAQQLSRARLDTALGIPQKKTAPAVPA